MKASLAYLNRVMRGAALIFLLVTVGPGCDRGEPVRVASKTSFENQILAEMFVLLAAEADVPVKRIIPYGNTFDTQEGIKEGLIDLYPEYTGTGAAMMGLPTMTDGDAALAAVRDAFEAFDIRWLDRLGFNNAYAVVTTTDRAAQLEVGTVEALSRQEVSVRLGCEVEYQSRPVDGLPALLRHYGWSPAPNVVTSESRQDLYRNLINEQVDAIVVHRTDPQIEEFGLVVLEDNLDFFPPYEAAALVRKDVLERFPDLEPALRRLAGRLDRATIQSLNRRVDLDGYDPREVAVRYLVDQGLLEEEPPELDQPVAVVATTPVDHRSATLVRALAAVRRALPSRRVELEVYPDPAEALSTGRAFVATVDAAYFFEVQPGALPTLRPRIEAVAPVAYRMAHLFRRRADGNTVATSQPGQPFRGVRRLGVGPADGSSHRAARILLDAYGVSDRVTLIAGDVDAQTNAVASGSLDALLLLATPGDAQPTLILRNRRLMLQPIADWDQRDRQFRYPFFRPARIPAGTYTDMDEPVVTIASQLVLAGPRPERLSVGDGDPMTGVRSERPPIPRTLKRSLVEALGGTEAIDPALPGESVGVARTRRESQPLNPTPEISVLNGFVLLVLGGFFYLLVSRKKPGPPSKAPPPSQHHPGSEKNARRQ